MSSEKFTAKTNSSKTMKHFEMTHNHTLSTYNVYKTPLRAANIADY